MLNIASSVFHIASSPRSSNLKAKVEKKNRSRWVRVCFQVQGVLVLASFFCCLLWFINNEKQFPGRSLSYARGTSRGPLVVKLFFASMNN